MPLRRPVVATDGHLQQVQSGDLLEGVLSYQLNVRSSMPTTTNFAVIGEINNTTILTFAATPNQSVIWQTSAIRYAGNGFLVRLLLSCPGSNVGNVQFNAEVEAQNTGSISTDSFATAVSSPSVTLPVGLGNYFTTTITIPHANADGMTDFAFMRLRLTRNTAVAGNTTSPVHFVDGSIEPG